MWTVTGAGVSATRFTPFEPGEILYDFDGPRIFTVRDLENEPYLACWSDENDQASRFIVAPTNERIVLGLKEGRLTVTEALHQSRCWICDVLHGGEVASCWRVEFENVPEDCLPATGTMLWSGLEEDSIDWVGRIRELDKDSLMFDLREIGGPCHSKRFIFKEDLLEQVLRALGDDAKVKVIGKNLRNRSMAQALSLFRISEKPSDKAAIG